MGDFRLVHFMGVIVCDSGGKGLGSLNVSRVVVKVTKYCGGSKMKEILMKNIGVKVLSRTRII